MTDHRIGLTLYKIDAIMDGALDELIDALTADQAELKQGRKQSEHILSKRPAALNIR